MLEKKANMPVSIAKTSPFPLVCASVLLFNVALSLPALAEAAPEAWFQCQSNDDCMKINRPCGTVAINKSFLDAYNQFVAHLPEEECPIPRDKGKESPALCRDNKCVVLYSVF